MSHASPRTFPALKKKLAANDTGNRPDAAHTRAIIAPADHTAVEKPRHNATMCHTLSPLKVIVQPSLLFAYPPREITMGSCLQVFARLDTEASEVLNPALRPCFSRTDRRFGPLEGESIGTSESSRMWRSIARMNPVHSHSGTGKTTSVFSSQ